MHRSSETIGAIAAALAKAQGELANPEKSLMATIRSPFPREARSDLPLCLARPAGSILSARCLGQHEIATVQTTAIDQDSGPDPADHAAGACLRGMDLLGLAGLSLSETATPHRMGAALTYARRYALFALVGIAGEDDLDAPDLLTEPSPGVATEKGYGAQNGRKPTNGSIHKTRQTKSILAVEPSAALRDQLIAEIDDLKDPGDLALWAHRRLPAKNTLTADDARAVEVAFQEVLNIPDERILPDNSGLAVTDVSGCPDHADHFALHQPSKPMTQSEHQAGILTINSSTLANAQQPPIGDMVIPLQKTIRKRNKAHLAFVAAQPCIVCRRWPCDAHHLKFAQPRSLGRKVSDKFTIPLCRDHHIQLHQHGNEAAWWANLKIAPLEMANKLWTATLLQESLSRGNSR